MNIKNRIKAFGLAVVMTTGLFLSSLPAVSAATTMNDIYYDAKQASVGNSTYKTALAKNKTLSANTSTIPKEYTYMLAAAEATNVTVNYTGQNTVDKGVALASPAYKKWWKLTDSMKGNIKATFTHCGYYQGKEINVVMTLLDWEFLDNNQARNNTVNDTSDDAKNVYVSFPAQNLTQGVNAGVNKIGVEVEYCSWIKVKYDFIDNNGNKVNVKGYTTFNDIDGGQGVHYISGHKNLYSTSDSALYYSEVNGTPYIFDKNNSSSNNEDKPYWITNTFDTSMTVSFTFGMNSRATSNTLYPGLGYFVRGGCGWITNYEDKVVRSETAEPVKTVSTNKLSDRNETFTYRISHTVPYESSDNYYDSYAITDKLPQELELLSTQVLNQSGSAITEQFTITKSNDNEVRVISKKANLEAFYNQTYTLVLTVRLKPEFKTSGHHEIKNKAYVQINGTKTYSNEVTTAIDLFDTSITKYINTSDESYTIHDKGEDVTYTGTAVVQNKSAVSSIVLSDKLDSNLKYKNLTVSHNGNDITDWGTISYDKDSNKVMFEFNSDKVASLAGETINYSLNCQYIGGISAEDKEVPNTIELIVNDETVQSNTPKLYISGVNAPVKSVDKLSINDKTETVTYTISSEFNSKTQEYFYDSCEIKDILEDIFDIKSVKILDENSTDVSELFDISNNDNVVTAVVKNTKVSSFYGHTYKLEIKASIKSNADLSAYLKGGKAVIPNTSTLTVDGNEFKSNTTNFTYQTKESSIDKYIVDSNGNKTDKTELHSNIVTYTGSAVIQDMDTVTNVVLTDKLNNDLKYKGLTVSLGEKDITGWGSVNYSEESNTVTFTVNSDKLSSVAGQTVTYNLTCDYAGEYSSKSVEIQNAIQLKVNNDTLTSNKAIFTTPVDPIITKYINESDESYSLHKNSEDITYTGTIIPGTTLKSKLEITDNLARGLTYKSFKVFNADGEDITSFGTNSSNGSTVKFVFSEDKLSEIYNTMLTYELVVTASKSYNGSTTEDEETPNTIVMVVEDETIESNTPKLYRSGVNAPEKSVDKSEISEKTETVTYTISNTVDSKTTEYFYDSYVITDTLESVLKYMSARVVNEDRTNVSNLFNIAVTDNTVTATAKNTKTEDFYGHTYKLVIEASISDKNTDISAYCDENGKAVIPNTSTLTVDGNAYSSNTVNFTYQTKENSVDKYILNLEGERVVESKLYDNRVTYTGEAVIQDKDNLTSVMLSDKLDSNLKYSSLTVSLDENDITDWGKASYDEKSSTAMFEFNADKLSDIAGQTITYKLNCDYVGKYSNESSDISNIIEFAVNEDNEKSNDTTLKIPVDSYITKHIYNGEELVNEYTLSDDRADNKVYYEGSILVSEKELVKSITFEDKLDSNLEFVSLRLINGSEDLKCDVTNDNGTIKAVLSDEALKNVEGKILEWNMTCNYIGEEKPSQTVTIPNTANVNINDEAYKSNEVEAYVSMVTAYSAEQNTKVKTAKQTKEANLTAQENPQSEQPYTGNEESKAPAILFLGVLAVIAVYAVYYFRKVKKDGKDKTKNKNGK